MRIMVPQGGIWQENTINKINNNMEEKSIRIIPFTGEKEKMSYEVGKIHGYIWNEEIRYPINGW